MLGIVGILGGRYQLQTNMCRLTTISTYLARFLKYIYVNILTFNLMASLYLFDTVKYIHNNMSA